MHKSSGNGSKIKGLVLFSFIIFIAFGFILGTSLANTQVFSDNSKTEIKSYKDDLVAKSNSLNDNSINSQSLVDVTDHGAVGDGTTDDHQAIMDALDYAVNNNKDGIYFPSGTYGISSQIYINSKYNGLSLISDDAAIKILTATTYRSIEMKGDSQGIVEDITIKGLTFDGNKDNLNVQRFDNWGIHVWSDSNTVRNIHIKDVEIYDYSGNGIRIASSDTVVKDVISHHNWGHGFNIGNTANNVLLDNVTGHHIVSPDNSNYGCGFDIHGGQSITVTNFVSRNNGYGMKTSTGQPTATIKNGVLKDNNWVGFRTSDAPTSLHFKNVTISGNGYSAMVFRYGGKITLEDVTQTNNGLTNSDYGSIYTADQMDDFDIVDLTILDFPGVGINSYTSGIEINNIDISGTSGYPLRLTAGGVLIDHLSQDNAQYWINSSLDVNSIKADSKGVALNDDYLNAQSENKVVNVELDRWTSTDRPFSADGSDTVTFKMRRLQANTPYSLYSSDGVTYYASTDSNGYLQFQYPSLSSESFNVQNDGVNLETQDATDITGSSAVLHGEVLNMDGKSSLDVFFRYRQEGNTVLQETTHRSVSSTTTFDETITGLSGSTGYEFKAVAQWSSAEVVSFPLTFTTSLQTDSYDWQGFLNPNEEDVIYKSTLPADITTTVNSVPNSSDDGTTLNYWGEFYVNGQYDGEKTLNPEPETTDYVYSGLSSGTHNLVVEWHYDMGFIEKDEINITVSAEPDVATNSATSITTNSAQLNGEVTEIGAESSVTTYFRYRKTGTSTWTETTHQILAGEVQFNQDVSGLSSDTSYDFKAVIEWGSNENTGSTSSFITDASSNSAPDSPTNPSPSSGSSGVTTSPSLSVDVSDPDGDSLDVTFYDASDDSVIGTDSSVASGGTASTPWSGLSHETSYSWYTVADDGNLNTQSSSWSFTTESSTTSNSAPDNPTNPSPSDGTTGISTSPTLSVDVSDPDGNTMDVTFYDASDDSVISTDSSVISGYTASITWSGSSHDTSYSWYAVSDDGSLDTQSSTWSFTTEQAPNSPPNQPNNPVPTDGATDVNTSVTLSVDVSDSDGDSMDVTFYDASDDSVIGTYLDAVSGGSASVTWSSLSEGTTYSWYAVANDSALENQSDTWSFTTLTVNDAPDTPTNPSPPDGATDISLKPTLNVDVSDTNGDSLDVTFYDASDDSAIGTDTNVASGNTASITWTGLSEVTTYSWYAVADDRQLQIQSNTWSFTTRNINDSPDTPINPSPSDGATGVSLEPTLSTDVSDPDGDSLDVTFYDASDNSVIGTDTNVASGNTASITWTGLSEETSYDWFVVANDTSLESQSSTWSFTTLTVNNAPDEPTNPSPLDGATAVNTSVTLSADVTDTDGDTLEVTFYDASDNSVIGTDTNVASGSTASVTWSSLSSYTQYNWYAVANDTNLENRSSTWSFTTEREVPTIQTIKFKNVTENSAILVGEVTDMGDYSEVSVSFKLREVDKVNWRKSSHSQMMSSTGEFQEQWSNLAPSTIYEFKAVLEYSDDVVTGEIKSFGTDILVEPGKPSEITYTSVKLRGELVDLGDHEQVEVYFEYKRDDSTVWSNTTLKAMKEPGDFNFEIDGLEPDTTYDYKAVAEGEAKVDGKVKSFETKSDDPIIADLSPGEGNKVNGDELIISAKIQQPLGYNITTTEVIIDDLHPMEADLQDNIATIKVPYILSDGEHTYELIVEDEKGNKNTTTVNFYVDNEKPELDLEIENDIGNNDILIIGTTEPGATVFINDIKVTVDEDGTFRYEAVLAKGENLFTITAKDESGNKVKRIIKGLYLPQLKELSDNIDNLEVQLEENRQTINKIDNTTEQLDREIDELKQNMSRRLHDLENDLVENTTALKEAIKQNNIEKIEEIQDNITDIESELTELSKEVNEIRDEYKNAREENDDKYGFHFGINTIVVIGLLTFFSIILISFKTNPKEWVKEKMKDR